MRAADDQRVTPRRRNRTVVFDPKSRLYLVRPLLDTLPDRPHFAGLWNPGPTLDQDASSGGANGCVPYAFAQWMNASPDRAATVHGDAFANDLYTKILRNDTVPGEAREGMSLLEASQVLKRFGDIANYYWCGAGSGDVIADVSDALRKIGPVIVGLFWRASMIHPAPSGLVTVTGPPDGGHAFVVLGEGTVAGTRVYVCQNPWGHDWGLDGLFMVPVDDMRALLEDQGEAVVPVKAPDHPFDEVDFTLAGRRGSAYFAGDAPSIDLGLKGVKSLGGYDGMLFDMGGTVDAPFTMRDTLLPLDIGWFDAQGRLGGAAHMLPGHDRYAPPVPYRYALELAGPLAAHLTRGSQLNTGISVADVAVSESDSSSRGRPMGTAPTDPQEKAIYDRGRADMAADMLAKVEEMTDGRGSNWQGRGSNWQGKCPECGDQFAIKPGKGQSWSQGLVRRRGSNWQQGLVKRRDGAKGISVTCPKCGHKFTIADSPEPDADD